MRTRRLVLDPIHSAAEVESLMRVSRRLDHVVHLLQQQLDRIPLLIASGELKPEPGDAAEDGPDVQDTTGEGEEVPRGEDRGPDGKREGPAQ